MGLPGVKVESIAPNTELADAVKGSVLDVTVNGKLLHLHKWTWRQSLTHGDKFVAAIGDAVRGKSATELLKQDVLKVIREQAEIVAGILVDTISTEDNFKDRTEAEQWFDTLPLDVVVELVKEVVRLNYIPLRNAFSALREAVIESGKAAESTPSATT